MADLQTLASPDNASVSSKKKKSKKKHKAIDAALNGESSAAAEDIDVAVDDSASAAAAKAIDVTVDDPSSASSKKKKKKHNKKSKAVDASHSGETSADATAINVTVDASLAGGSAAAAAAPVVGYFPTGYNPLAANGDSPSARVFRNVKHPGWIDLVVRPPGKGPDFVGKSYAGEAAIPQLCNYALGVLDKASGTFKVVPIAGNKVYGSSCCTKISNIFRSRKRYSLKWGLKQSFGPFEPFLIKKQSWFSVLPHNE
jgi:DNA-directed RNA polymerase I subunit RPA49